MAPLVAVETILVAAVVPRRTRTSLRTELMTVCKGVATCPQQSDEQEEELDDVDTSVEAEEALE
jgi:hypothetical protein